MGRSKPLAIVAGAVMFALAACGGGQDTDAGQQRGAADEITKNEGLAAPAAEIAGAAKGGTITVYLPDDAGPADLDPTNGWSVAGNAIQQALTSRSLTQYAKNPDTGAMELVPDLATDLGTPNNDFTEWTFTIRDDAMWESGETISPEEVAWGICRSMDSDAFPSGPGTAYSQTYFFGAGDYKGPYTEKDPNCDNWGGVEVNGQALTIKMDKPFPDMDWWGAFMAMGPAPLGRASEPPAYGQNVLSNGPYKVERFRPGVELVLVRNDQWNPDSDLARHQYADRFVFKFNQDQAKVDQFMLSDNTQSQTSLSTAVGSNNYQRINNEFGDRLVQQSSPCTSFLAPDYNKITDINVRKAIAWAYPYEDVWLASGEVLNVTRVPANSVMPPGMAGKPEYFADGAQFEYNPARAKELLAKAGYADEPYPITMLYEANPLAEAAQEQVVKGMEEAGFEIKGGGIPVQDEPYSIMTNPDNRINKKLNLRHVNRCSDWPSGLTMLPPLLRTGGAYNTAFFSDKSIDEEFDTITELPLGEQAEAWGALDERIGTEYFPLIPTAFRNDLFVFGSKIGNGTGDGAIGAPYYKGMYVSQ
jgi:peptide/nickel transport system substrate-binding protein